MRMFSRRAAALGVVLAVTGGAGAAYAAWTSHGVGTAGAGAQRAQSLHATAGAFAGVRLYPGGTGDAQLTISNPNPYPVRVTDIVANGPVTVTAGNGVGGCTRTGVRLIAQHRLALDIAAKGAAPNPATFTLRKAVAMSNDSDSGCQGATFGIPVSLTAHSNA